MVDSAPPPSHPRARRLGTVLVTALVALAGVAAVILFFQGRDDSQLDRPATAGPGRPLADRGRTIVGGGLERFGGEGEDLSATALADVLERGNVVVLYGTPNPPTALTDLARRFGGFDQALVYTGQGVVLARRAGQDGIIALARHRMIDVADAADPALERFVGYWLGRG